MALKKEKNWWKKGVIYQIYPRSFKDTNGDGIGDFKGITEKIDYLASMGIDAIWISPFMKSPMKDFGYDVSEYKAVDPIFGTMDDFKTLLSKAHEKNIGIIIDVVLSHTSDQHPWFMESRKDKTNSKASWYVWADPKADGTPPNNWLSIFGGSAWQWDGEREQYYMHNFLRSQPDLNFHNPDVQKALLDACRFWLDLGVDGFRLDTINFYFHSKTLKDNPPAVHEIGGGDVSRVNPYAYQEHLYDKSQPENIKFLEELRILLNTYDAISVGEVGENDALITDRIVEYTQGTKRMHMCYGFDFMNNVPFKPSYFAEKLNIFENKAKGEGWINRAFTNHDTPRAISHFSKNPAQDTIVGTLLLALHLGFRATPCIYQGEELGMHESDVPFEKIQDPYGIEFWPKFKGRDGCRTPMAWDSTKQNGGFTTAKEGWLPVDSQHIANAADIQEKNPHALLNHYREMLQWYKEQEVLQLGTLEAQAYNDDKLLVLKRALNNEIWYCLYNFTSAVEKIATSTLGKALLKPIACPHAQYNQANDAEMITLQPYGFAFFQVV